MILSTAPCRTCDAGFSTWTISTISERIADMLDVGKGPTLREASPWLRDDAERHTRILDVVERDSVIEGLPAFSDATRQRLLQMLRDIDGTRQGPQCEKNG